MEFMIQKNPELVAVLIVALITLIKLGTTWMKTKQTELAANIKSQKVRDAFIRGTDLIYQAVNDTAQEEGVELKKALNDGHLSDEEAVHLKQVARDKVMKLLTEDMVADITTNVKDFNLWLDTMIETMVVKSKNEKKK